MQTTKKQIENFNKAIGARIKQLRKQKKISAQAFAQSINISRTLYQTYETGTNITSKNLLRVTNGLGLTIKQFFEEGF